MKDKGAILIHDVVTLGFLIPFSVLCLVEVAFQYTLYPLFLTHALVAHMLFDLVWIYCQPQIIASFRKLIIFHHLVALSLLMYPIFKPFDARFTAICGIIEFDTSLLILRRLPIGNKKLFSRLYLLSNLFLRVYYETFLSILIWNYFRYDSVWVRLHVISGQLFINVFSCGICALTYSREIKKHV
jgi:hypothetical protein